MLYKQNALKHGMPAVALPNGHAVKLGELETALLAKLASEGACRRC